MSLSPLLPFPVVQWQEPTTALLTAAPFRTYWALAASVYTLTSVSASSAAELVDLGGTGVYTLELLGVAGPTITRLNGTQRGTSIFFY